MGCSGGGEIGGEKTGELNPDWLGGGDAMKLGVVLPDPKNISLEGVPLAEEEAAGLYTESTPPPPPPVDETFLLGCG